MRTESGQESSERGGPHLVRGDGHSARHFDGGSDTGGSSRGAYATCGVTALMLTRRYIPADAEREYEMFEA
jgi:hypothetical protein